MKLTDKINEGVELIEIREDTCFICKTKEDLTDLLNKLHHENVSWNNGDPLPNKATLNILKSYFKNDSSICAVYLRYYSSTGTWLCTYSSTYPKDNSGYSACICREWFKYYIIEIKRNSMLL